MVAHAAVDLRLHAHGGVRVPVGVTRTLAAAAVALLLVGCSADAPTQGDIRPEVYAGYPGATETSRQWSGEERGRSVDGSDLFSPARLTLRFSLAEPVTNASLWEWYERELTPRGWTRRRRAVLNVADFDRTAGDRVHALVVKAGTDRDQLVTDYTVNYTIGVQRDGS